MTLRIGLTGGIGAGKSAVSRVLADLGAIIIDADVLAREVVEPGTPGLAAVVAEFGEQVLAADGSLDRAAVADIVFADEAARKRLESIVHPLVFERIVDIESRAGRDDVVVHDIPLLTESGRADTFDAVVVVDVPEDLQVERLTRMRQMAPDEARARMAAQASRADRLAIATHVVDNSGTLPELRAEVTRIWHELTRERP